MTPLDAARILCVVLAILPLSWSVPIDIGTCEPWRKSCQCGTPGYPFQIEIKQCIRFYRWKPSCKPCENVDEDALCQPYTHCLECSPNVQGCVKCPEGRYGHSCNLECGCQNGGLCNESGRCSCPVGFEGLKCEKKLECTPPLLNDHLSIRPNGDSYSVQTTVFFQCEEGFLLEGATSAHCNDNGRWSIISPICLPLCKELPVPDHGSSNLPLGRIVPGTMVSFVCSQGFAISGPSSRRCQEDGTWSRSQPKCEPSVQCPVPTIPDNSFVLDSSSKKPFSPGGTLSLRCSDGFIMVGEDTMTCGDTGNWSQQPPICVREQETCLDPGPLQNGRIKVPEGPAGGRIRLLGTKLEFSCEPLYFLVGSSTATCEGNGTWSSPLPACIKVTTCGALEGFPNGIIQILKPEAGPRSVRTFSQASTMNVTRRTGKGRFRTNFRPQAAGPQPRHQEAALKMNLPNGFYHVGTQANFECESKYYNLQGSHIRTCMPSGEWSGRPSTCIPVCGRSSDPRTPFITHGTPSDIGQWPWIVGVSRLTLDDDYKLHCGASLIDERWVITAAHCVTYEFQPTLLPVNELQFYAGKYFWNNSLDDGEVQVRQAEVIHVHPDYDPFSMDSDLAIVRLSQPVRLSSRVQPVCLPTTDPIESQDRLKEGNRGVVIGWGETEDADTSDVLLHVQAPVIATDKCIQGYKEAGLNIRVTSNMFCAGYEAGKHDACNGDSGGPFVFPADASATRYVLEGVTSWGSPYGCGLKKQYGGYVRVQMFIDWIHNFV